MIIAPQVHRYSSLRMLLALCLGIILLALATIAFAQDTGDHSMKTVVAEGVGAGPGRAKARDEAIQDAQRKAVEQGLGLYIKSETVVSNLELVSDNIYKQSSGFVHKYSVVSENYDENTDLCRVKIKADVSLERIESVLETLYDKLKMAGSPRILLMIEGTDSLSDAEGVVNSLTGALVEKGFKVLDDDQLTAVRQKDALRMIRDGEADAKTIMLLQDKADLIIVGKASADKAERIMNDPTTYSQRVTLNAKIIRVDTAEILGSKRGQGLGADFTVKGAQESAEDKSGVDYLDKNLGTMLRAVLDPCKEYTVKVSGCSFAQLNQVNDKIVASRFARETDTRFEDGYGIVTASFGGKSTLLASHLETAPGIRLKVTSVTGMTILVKIVK